MATTFLQAEWRKLIMANYAVEPAVLQPFLPANTELDVWNNTCYVSLVGFLFTNTRLKGIKVPFHSDFEEVNLRFYVRFNDNGTWKRGVVFISEVVPKPAITFVANTIYGEKYATLPMRHHWQQTKESLTVEYQWKKTNWQSLKIVTAPEPMPIAVGSEEEFITEHYWGYTKRRDGRTSEYGVEHPRWLVYPMQSYQINADFAAMYGASFGFLHSQQPQSVFLAEGSDIVVKGKRVL
jgi:uncharacterized protein YqjF (DUF2071 family)